MVVGAVGVPGINWGIDFSGGMEMQVKFKEPVQGEDLRKTLEELGFKKHQVQQHGGAKDNEWLLSVERTSSLRPAIKSAEKAIEAALGKDVTLDFSASETASACSPPSTARTPTTPRPSWPPSWRSKR
jgi:preprotein translocase subunit SecF